MRCTGDAKSLGFKWMIARRVRRSPAFGEIPNWPSISCCIPQFTNKLCLYNRGMTTERNERSGQISIRHLLITTALIGLGLWFARAAVHSPPAARPEMWIYSLLLIMSSIGSISGKLHFGDRQGAILGTWIIGAATVALLCGIWIMEVFFTIL